MLIKACDSRDIHEFHSEFSLKPISRFFMSHSLLGFSVSSER